MDNTNRPTTINAVHCQQCGRTDEEYVGYDALRSMDGYTACCNERAIYPQAEQRFDYRTGGYIDIPGTAKCDPADCYHE